jgi:hypothetical protein
MDRRRLHTVTRRVLGKVLGGGAFLAIVERMSGGPIPAEAAFVCELKAAMNGAKETDGNGNFDLGDPDGRGTACIDLKPGRICWQITVRKIGPDITASHIHRGNKTQKNGPLVDFGKKLQGCTSVEQSVITEIRTTPGQFYVNVHTPQFPDGAIRGQLKQV